MNFIKQILIGFVIGGGMILPGVSGGVLAVIFGIYEEMLNAVANFFKDVKKNILFLGPLVLGVVIGVFLFGKVLFFVFEEYPVEAKFTFIGLILGGLPALFKEVENSGDRKLKLCTFFISFTISITLFVLGRKNLNIDFSTRLDEDFISFILLFTTGFIFIAGKIIPGISSSFLLMLIGMYQFFLTILNNPFNLSNEEYLQLIPFVLGITIGAVILISIIRRLIKNHFSHTYSAIIGFVIGSIVAIYPGISTLYSNTTGVLLSIISFIFSYKFIRVGQKGIKQPQKY